MPQSAFCAKNAQKREPGSFWSFNWVIWRSEVKSLLLKESSFQGQNICDCSSRRCATDTVVYWILVLVSRLVGLSGDGEGRKNALASGWPLALKSFYWFRGETSGFIFQSWFYHVRRNVPSFLCTANVSLSLKRVLLKKAGGNVCHYCV